MLPPANSEHQAAFWMTAQDGGHLFGLSWDVTMLGYRFDGRPVRTYTGVGVPRVPEAIRASVGILDWHDEDIRTAALPQETRFDLVYAWQLMNQNSLTLVDSDSALIKSSGSDWQRKTSSGDYGGAMLQSGTSGDSITLPFGGTAADVFVRKGQFGGLVDVSLDGRFIAAGLDTYSPTQVLQHRLYSVDGLTPEPHTIRVQATGRANPAAVGTLLMFDAMQYLALPPSALVTIGVASGSATQATAGYQSLSASMPVLKTGGATLVLDRPNELTGSFTVEAGAVRLAHAAALATTRVVPLDGGRCRSTRRCDPGSAGSRWIAAGSSTWAKGR